MLHEDEHKLMILLLQKGKLRGCARCHERQTRITFGKQIPNLTLCNQPNTAYTPEGHGRE